MASSKRIINVGASARASDVQKVSDVAAAADDRATEILCTPGSNLKTIKPLSEESATVNPRLLVVGQDTDATVPNGKVRVRPAHFQAGSDAYTIALSAALKANADSPTIGNNSSGSTRTDLLYAVIDYGTTTTETVRQKPTSGSTPVSVSLTTQKDMLVTIAVVAGVAAGNPLASLPADDTVNGVYNFGLAALAIPNGFTGGAIDQSVITQLWSGGFVSPGRIRGVQPASLYYGAASEKPGSVLSSGVQGAERWGSVRHFFAHLKVLSTTGNTVGTGLVVDNTIDWRNRFIWGRYSYLGPGNTSLPVESSAFPLPSLAAVTPSGSLPQNVNNTGVLGLAWTGPGANSGTTLCPIYYSNASAVAAQSGLYVNTAGDLVLVRASVIDGVNGDALALVLYASDKLIASV